MNLLTTCGQRVGLPKSPSVSLKKVRIPFPPSPFFFFFLNRICLYFLIEKSLNVPKRFLFTDKSLCPYF